MSCKYKDQCPSASGWCEGPRQDFSQCVAFLVSAYEALKRAQPPVLYLCDRRACETCRPTCFHTSDIRHAKHFALVMGRKQSFIETGGDENGDQLLQMDSGQERDALHR